MTDPLLLRVDTVLGALLEAPEESQVSLLESLCGEDRSLRREVASLLAWHRSAGNDAFLETPRIRIDPESLPALIEDGEPLAVGDVVGGWLISERLGAGGMATVYAATRERSGFTQRGALKILRRGLDTADVLRRFRRERQILARLEHPGIARLIDGGATADGRPFLVMEAVEGEALLDACRRRALPIRQRTEITRALCDSVQFAHRNLVVHRDIKPSNILLTPSGAPKLLDFGIAGLLEPEQGTDGEITKTIERRLTPRYASPEQRRGEPVTVVADVYALGVVLGELLDEFTESMRPHPRVTEDLRRIVAMATHEEPDRRYPSARALAEDLLRWEEGRPIEARADALSYRLGCFLRRHAVASALSAALLLLLVGGAAIVLGALAQARHARDSAIAQTMVAEQTVGFLDSVLGAIDPAKAKGRDTTLLADMLEDASSRVDRELADAPAAAASLHLTLGRGFKAIARYDQARHHLERALSLARIQAPGSTLHAEAAEALAVLDLDTDRFDGARPLLEEARAAMALMTPSDDVAAARLWRHTAHLERNVANLDAAETACAEAIGIHRRREALLRGTPLPPAAAEMEYAAALLEQSVLLANRGRAADAAASATEASTIVERLEGPDHPQAIRALYNLAWAQRRAGQLAESEHSFRTALERMAAVLHHDHPDIASATNNLAGVLEEQGRWQEAEPLYLEAIERMRRVLGERHVDVGTAINNLGGLYRRMGRLESAIGSLTAARQIYVDALGPEHPWIAIVAETLARTHEAAGDLLAARPHVEESVRIRAARADPAERWLLERARSLLGLCLVESGEIDQGRAVLAQAVAYLEANRPANDPALHLARERQHRALQANPPTE